MRNVRWSRVGAVLGVLILCKVGCVVGLAGADDAESRLAYVSHRLATEPVPDGHIDREWYLVSLSMAGLAEGNLAFRDAGSRARRLQSVERLVEKALSPAARKFDSESWGSDARATLDGPQGHVGYLGHLGLLLGTECALGGRKHEDDRRRIAAALERRFLAASDGLVDTYPNQVWIPDSAAALAAVAISNRCDGRSVPDVLSRWPADRRTGIFNFTRRTGARASGAGWCSIYLPFIDAEIARDQLEKAKKVFAWHGLGMVAWREYPHGVAGKGDVDSGPLVCGLSPAGTGFALAGVTLAKSPDVAGMLRTAEAAGFTVPWGGRHYLLAPLVGDASVLAARTATPWELPPAR